LKARPVLHPRYGRVSVSALSFPTISWP